MPKYQRNRVYSLIVGNESGAVEINNLQIKFVVTKTSDNKDKKNEASIEIYNLSESRRKALEEDYVRVSLRVGYSDTDLVELFSGQVVNIQNNKHGINHFLTTRNGTDLVTKLDIDELYTQLNNKSLSKVVPSGKTVRDVILEVIKDIPEVTRQEIRGVGVARQLPDGFPVSGTPRQVLDKLSKAYDISWSIDAGVLYVYDVDGTFTESTEGVPLIGQFSGLIERPEFINPDAKRKRNLKLTNAEKTGNKKRAPKKKTLKMTILLNPAIIAGSVIKLEFEDLTGYYKVDEVVHKGDFRGNEWYSHLKCTERLD